VKERGVSKRGRELEDLFGEHASKRSLFVLRKTPVKGIFDQGGPGHAVRMGEEGCRSKGKGAPYILEYSKMTCSQGELPTSEGASVWVLGNGKFSSPG